MKFSRGGLICVCLYTCYILFMLAAAYLAADSKTRGFFLALSALPGWLVVGAMPEAAIERLLVDFHLVLEVIVYLLSFAIAYLSGWVLEKIILSITPWLNRLDDRWFCRVHRDDR